MSENKPELTAEWTVHAQLTISHPNATVKTATTGGSTNNRSQPTGDPFKVVYKWTTDDRDADRSETKGPNVSFQKTIFTTDSKEKDKCTGTFATSSEIPFSETTNSTNKPLPYDTRCQSTCSIVLSAFTNLPPIGIVPETDQKLSVKHPEQITIERVNEQIPSIIRSSHILCVKDAFSQTSDNEKQCSDKSATEQKKRRHHKRAPVSAELFQEERNKFSPFRLSPSPVLPADPNSISTSYPTAFQKSGTPKKPRTVHIDVYCTGSEAEDSGSPSSDESEVDHHEEIESNTTHQTVIDSSEMKLQHMRMDAYLPRRLTGSANQNNLRTYLESKVNTKKEICESKQMLFDKHMGDKTTRNLISDRFVYHKDPSDDCISSGYPNSSRSTIRDLTCSSISSALASSSVVNEDLETTWKDFAIDVDTGILQIDNENGDLSRILNLEEKLSQIGKWRSPEKERKFLLQQKITMDYMKENEKDSKLNEELQKKKKLHSLSFRDNIRPKVKLDRAISSQEFSSNIETVPVVQISEYNQQEHDFFVGSNFTSNLSQAQNCWTRAKMFGDVIRKKGRHFGPAKNPDCQCSHCRRWIAERESQGRQRASSTGDVPYTKPQYWRHRNM